MQSGKPCPSRKPRSYGRPGKSKSVTYTGCWTCRSRKIKCDERKKNGCGICERAGLECAGYGVTLYWVTGRRQDLPALQRRTIKLDQSSSLFLPDSQINHILTAIDTVSAPSNTICMGPFSIFQVQSSISSHTEPELPSHHDVEDIGRFPIQRKTITSQRLSSPHLELSLPLFQDPETSLLLFHYKDHVAGLLQPVLHPNNPWRTTYVPFALEGRPDLFLAQNGNRSCGASTAIFHSLLSSAAFHLRNATGGSERFHKLGLRYRTKALQALNSALIQPENSQLYTVQLTAMLSLVTIDTMTGEDSDFPIHLKGCQQLRQLHLARDADSSSRQVRLICRFLTLLGRTTSVDLQPRSWTIDDWCLEAPLFNEEDRDIEYIYGVTPALGNLLHQTCQIAEALALYKDFEIPQSVLDARHALRFNLFTWKIQPDDFVLIKSDRKMMEIIRCQAHAFYSAILIFYCRAVEHHPLIDLGSQVANVWESLTRAETLKERDMEKQRLSAPMSWPAFIAACEATDRERWRTWWERVQRYNLGNFRRQWNVIQEVWSITDAHPNGICWRDALQSSGQLVLPI
ncbi:uncharacterized protein N7459_005761 [Penicillium hispanicum]|uniref:uncharacterized protein n=1 Tax=Penicillium hispanicum TaxID=1080232 RepID=UPI00254088B0|nr:uncharacterized protein N7459_005761 [Penicillium hispanicum]KAJ5579776.1 hypothetical protein N7459_005761 [Penicillium hispanicum]